MTRKVRDGQRIDEAREWVSASHVGVRPRNNHSELRNVMLPWSFVTDASAPEPELLTLAVAALQLEFVDTELATNDLVERLEAIGQSPLDRRLRSVDREERFEAVLAAQVAVETAATNNPQLSNCSGGNLSAESSAEESR